MLRTALLAAAAAAVVTADVQFAADVSSTPFAFRPVLQRCFGSGHAALTLRQDWRDQLKTVKNDIGNEYVRFHGLLDDDMSVVLQGDDGKLTYSFANIFNTFDFLLSINVRPIVELSFMPQLLAANASETVFHYNGITSPPADYNQWSELVTALVSALVDRYGVTELQQWKFEVWNEPNCGFWSGTQQQYFTMYNYTSRAVKAANPTLKVGGPATCQLGWIPEFHGNVTAMGAPVDMITTHLYPTDPMLQATRTSFTDAIADRANLTASYGIPLVMTEFNSGLGLPEGQDGPFAAAFVAHTALAIQAIPNLDILSFWTFTDVFEEGGFDSRPYHKGYGIQTYNGIPKLAYRSFQLLNQLLDNAVLLDTQGTVDIVVTLDKSSNQYVVLLVNYNWYQLPIADESVTVSLKGLPCQPDNVMVTYVDSANSNAQAMWEQMGSPTYMNAGQISKLVQASMLQPSSTPFSKIGTSGIQFTLDLPPFSVVSATLQNCH